MSSRLPLLINPGAPLALRETGGVAAAVATDDDDDGLEADRDGGCRVEDGKRLLALTDLEA